MKKTLPALAMMLMLCVLAPALNAAEKVVGARHRPITRDEIIKIAKTYADCEWQCSAKNVDPKFNKLEAGKTYRGVAYNWGGWDTVAAFKKKIAFGAVAGTIKKEEYASFAGVDCSGFVSRCWGIEGARYSTRTLPEISLELPWSELKRGDILNFYNHHVRLFDHYDPKDPNLVWVYESTGDTEGRNGIPVVPSRVIYRAVRKDKMIDDGYRPLRYRFIKEDGGKKAAPKTAGKAANRRAAIKARPVAAR